MAIRNDGYDMFANYLVERYAPSVLFLAPNLDILYINGNLDDYFTLPKAIARFNVAKMVDQDVLIVFQNGVSKALVQENPVMYRNIVFLKSNTEHQVDLKFKAVNLPGVDQELVMTEIFARRAEKGAQEEEDQNVLIDQYSRRLDQQIRDMSRGTQQLISELEAANEELQASNGELMAANEELQSTNEELQSVNEELNTVNSELQFKNEELATANNDINNLLNSTNIGTVFLDTQRRIRNFTPSITLQFKLQESDIGRPITDFSSTLKSVNIADICEKVYRTLENFEEEVIDQEGNHYLLRILPYRTRDDEIRGLVITFIDLAELEKARELRHNMANKYRAISSYSNHAILTVTPDSKILHADTTWEDFTSADLEGKVFFNLIRKEDRPAGRKALKKMLDEKQAQEFDCRMIFDEQDKEYILWATLIPLEKHVEDVKEEVLILLEDHTDEQAEQDKRLRDLKEYMSFVENSPQQMAIINEEGKIRFINFTRYTGIDRQQMIGTSIYDYLPADEHKKIKEIVHHIFSGKPSEKFIFFFEHSDGRRLQYELLATPVVVDRKIRYVALIGRTREK